MSGGLPVDRRTTLAWLAAALAVPEAAARGSGVEGTSWPAVQLTPVTAPGYGVDPNLLEPVVPWPLTLTKTELTAAAALCDMIMPADGEYSAASAVGVPAFIDEWVSAPYPSQHRDRGLIIPGLAWLDRESFQKGNSAFASASPEAQRAIIDRIAFRERIEPGLEKPAEFFGRMRALTMGAYYTTQEGWKDIGYLGNRPITGEYPGPTPEALAHIKGVIEGKGLKFALPENGPL
jgi:hypothetical protein